MIRVHARTKGFAWSTHVDHPEGHMLERLNEVLLLGVDFIVDPIGWHTAQRGEQPGLHAYARGVQASVSEPITWEPPIELGYDPQGPFPFFRTIEWGEPISSACIVFFDSDKKVWGWGLTYIDR